MLVKDIVTEMDSIILVEMMGSREQSTHSSTWPPGTADAK